MTLSIEAAIALVTIIVAAQFAILTLIYNLVLAIWKALAQTVTHEVCGKRRAECPCTREIENIKKQMEKMEDR